MKQTSVEWLKKELETHGTRDICVIGWEELDSLIEQAKELRKKEMIKFTNFENKKNQKQLIVKIMEEDYKDGLYDTSLQECVNCNEQKQVHSMCLDCCIKLGNQNQTEISDEEIEKEAKQTYREHPNNPKEFTDWSYGKDVNFARKQKAFIKGAKWYREQLKSKGNG